MKMIAIFVFIAEVISQFQITHQKIRKMKCNQNNNIHKLC